MTSSPSNVDAALQRVLAGCCKGVGVHAAKGRVATYIPALARVDPTRFGLAVRRTSGPHATEREAEERFSIQSISKVFTLSMVLRRVGARLWTRMGREPSGSPFNSIVQLEHERG
ncbi:MAG: glutaminase, partial [Pseudomonadales bacterium]